MGDFHKYSDFVDNYPFEQQDLAQLIFGITNMMNTKKIEYYPFDYSMILLKRSDNNALEFEISNDLGDESVREMEKTVTEYEKMLPICKLIISFFRSNPAHNEFEAYNEVLQDRNVIKEFKHLLRSAYSETSILTFKMFCNRIKDIHNLFSKENVYFINGDPENDALASEFTHRSQLKRCNYCDSVSLEPIFILNECGCIFHKLCFEATIIDTIESKELKSDFKLRRECGSLQNHLHTDDLIFLVEIEKERFTLSNAIINMIKYYYLNSQEDATFYCNCTREHKKVDLISKRPYKLCNARCSYCGQRWEENCQKFAKILNW